jgi:hypothetical protein
MDVFCEWKDACCGGKHRGIIKQVSPNQALHLTRPAWQVSETS